MLTFAINIDDSVAQTRSGYMSVGIALGKHAGRSGMETVPNREFWKAVPGLVGAGCAHTFGRSSAIRKALVSYNSYEDL